MFQRQSGLGRGLGALIPPKPSVANSQRDVAFETPLSSTASETVHAPIPHGTLCHISVDSVETNPHQPRRHFDHAAMEDLVSSIKEHGIIEPLVVTQRPNGQYELVAGE